MTLAPRITSTAVAAGLALLVGILLGASPASGAESFSDSDEQSAEYERLMKKGRAAYNKQRWAEAARNYRDAAQVAPEKPLVYRNLARAYFQRGAYARATTYYDHYLNLVEDGGDHERIRRERKLAAHRAGDKVWTIPDSQKRVLEALRDALTKGEAYTEGGGGAWALYKTLLRAGYAHPDLAHLQKRLRKALVEEFEGLLVRDADQPTPVLTLEQWQRQQRRLEAARTLTSASGVRKSIERRTKVADCGIALLNGRYDALLETVGGALESNPDMGFVRWYELVALIETEQYERARQRIADAREGWAGDISKTRRRYLQLLEAIVAHRSGAHEQASTGYLELLE